VHICVTLRLDTKLYLLQKYDGTHEASSSTVVNTNLARCGIVLHWICLFIIPAFIASNERSVVLFGSSFVCNILWVGMQEPFVQKDDPSPVYKFMNIWGEELMLWLYFFVSCWCCCVVLALIFNLTDASFMYIVFIHCHWVVNTSATPQLWMSLYNGDKVNTLIQLNVYFALGWSYTCNVLCWWINRAYWLQHKQLYAMLKPVFVRAGGSRSSVFLTLVCNTIMVSQSLGFVPMCTVCSVS